MLIHGLYIFLVDFALQEMVGRIIAVHEWVFYPLEKSDFFERPTDSLYSPAHKRLD
jgi:hypothetical protein